jgi:hypothetical protein
MADIGANVSDARADSSGPPVLEGLLGRPV